MASGILPVRVSVLALSLGPCTSFAYRPRTLNAESKAAEAIVKFGSFNDDLRCRLTV